MKLNIIEFLPFFYLFLALISLLLERFGVYYLHIIFLIFSIITLLPNIIKSFKNGGVFIWSFVFSVFTMFSITIFLDMVPFKEAVRSAVIYTAPPIFWLLFFNKIDQFDFYKFKKFAIYTGFVVCILGLVQFFSSKTIYGLIPTASYLEIDFTKDYLVSAGSHFRIRSILPSSQIFGLYSSLIFCMITSVYNNKIKYIIFLGGPVLLASLLSGQRIVLLVYITYFSVKLIYNLKFSLIKSLIFLMAMLLLLFLMDNVVNNLLINQGMSESRIFDIFFNFENVLKYEKSARWGRWLNLLNETNFIIGNGIGYTGMRDFWGLRYVTSESYIVQIYFEGGIFVLFSFLILYLKSINKYKINLAFDDNWILLVTLFFATIAVHSFLHPVFFVFWGIIVHPFTPALKHGLSCICPLGDRKRSRGGSNQSMGSLPRAHHF